MLVIQFNEVIISSPRVADAMTYDDDSNLTYFGRVSPELKPSWYCGVRNDFGHFSEAHSPIGVVRM